MDEDTAADLAQEWIDAVGGGQSAGRSRTLVTNMSRSSCPSPTLTWGVVSQDEGRADVLTAAGGTLFITSGAAPGDQATPDGRSFTISAHRLDEASIQVTGSGIVGAGREWTLVLADRDTPIVLRGRVRQASSIDQARPDEVEAFRAGSRCAPWLRTARQRFGRRRLRARVVNAAVARANANLERDGLVPLPDGLTPHKLRHTFASLLFALGHDPAHVMGQLGHTDLALTLRVYAHGMRRGGEEKKRLRALIEAADSALDWAPAAHRDAEPIGEGRARARDNPA